MNLTARAWLPEDALTIDRIDRALKSCVDGWADEWFIAGASPIHVAHAGLPLDDAVDQAMISRSAAIEVRTPPMGKRVLLEMTLGEPLAGKEPTPADHQLMDGLVSRAILDLAARLGVLLAPGMPGDGPVDQLSLLIEGTEICRFAYARAAMIALLRRTMEPSVRSSNPTIPVLKALGPARIDFEAILGQVDLSIDDLRDLEAGDVLVLDRNLSATAELRLAAAGRTFAYGRPTTADGRNAVTL